MPLEDDIHFTGHSGQNGLLYGPHSLHISLERFDMAEKTCAFYLDGMKINEIPNIPLRLLHFEFVHNRS